MTSTQLSTDLYIELRNAARPLVKAKGSVLFHAGQPVKGAFLVRRGRVRMTLDRSRLYPACSVGAGSIIGLPATFSGEHYSLTAKAERYCHLDFIPRARLLDLLLRNPKAGFQIVRILSEEIFQIRNAVTEKRSRAIPKHRFPASKAEVTIRCG